MVAPARTSKPTKKVTFYTNNKELGELIDAWKHARTRMKRDKQSRLIAVLYKIAGGVWDRYEFTVNRDDFCQDCMFNYFEKALDRIDTSKNCFSYLTTCAVNFGMRSRHQAVLSRRAEFEHGLERINRHFSEC